MAKTDIIPTTTRVVHEIAIPPKVVLTLDIVEAEDIVLLLRGVRMSAANASIVHDLSQGIKRAKDNLEAVRRGLPLTKYDPQDPKNFMGNF